MTEPRAPVVSVVVSTYERADDLRGLVAAFERQTLERSRFEVVVVDDGSSDETPELLEELEQHPTLSIRTLRNPVNAGPAVGRNRGVEQALGEVVAFTDDDCRPDPGWLEAGLAAFDDDVGVVQGRTRPAGPTGPFSVTQDIDHLTGLYETCNLFVRTALFRAVGGCDESFRFFGEDTVIGWSIRRLGWRARFAPDAVVAHAVTEPPFGWHLRRARMYAAFPRLARAFPELRSEMFWNRVFLRRRSASVALAVGGVGLAPTLHPAAALAALPWVWHYRQSLRQGHLRLFARQLAFDLAVERALVAGSIRHRSVVL